MTLDINLWWCLDTFPEKLSSENSKKHLEDLLAGIDKSLPYEDPQDLVKENNLVIGSMGKHVQCVINFADNKIEDGGTLIVPGFIQHVEKFCEIYRPVLKKQQNLPFLTLPKDIEEKYMPSALRVSMKAGSVLIWNQLTMHGTTPNESKNSRFAQFLKAFSRAAVYTTNRTNPSSSLTVAPRSGESSTSSIDQKYIERFYRRSALIKRCLSSSGIDYGVCEEKGGGDSDESLVKAERSSLLSFSSLPSAFSSATSHEDDGHLKYNHCLCTTSITKTGRRVLGIE